MAVRTMPDGRRSEEGDANRGREIAARLPHGNRINESPSGNTDRQQMRFASCFAKLKLNVRLFAIFPRPATRHAGALTDR
jgi:hypothetical protein